MMLFILFNVQCSIFNIACAQDINKAFNEKTKLVGNQYTKDIEKLANPKEREAMKFLYAYMPIADITDYPMDFHLKHVRQSFQTREEMAWGKRIPDLLFRHFVLPIRVNNEALDTARIAFYRELKDRVKGMSMKDAILEVNHWCHEKVTYAPSDGRTLAPLACVKNALGRCGEESTFTVTALRSVGIPARQVYTPRWAHTDDNHAWVEAWADGTWYFLGACEPEPVLNLAWFNAPASRAMLMHTRAFGDYRGPEEVMLRTSCLTEINLIDNYGSSARLDFRVVDEKGKPVSDARVDFKIYNYAEFCTVATKYTDKKGRTFLTAGKGDMLVWASKGGKFGYVKASFGQSLTSSEIKNSLSPALSQGEGGIPHNRQIVKSSNRQNEITISLNYQLSTINSQLQALDIVPPPERVMMPEVTKEMREENQRRFAYEDSIRRAYEATFYRQEQGARGKGQETAPLNPPVMGDFSEEQEKFLVTARGNWRVIKEFMERHSDQKERVETLLASLSDKDLRDMPMEILEDNFTAVSDQLCPRVENEMILHPFKHYLREEFLKHNPMPTDPAQLVKWVKDSIRLNPDTRALRIAQTPVGVWQSRVTDTRSRDIFFVDLARSLGIEARKDVVTGKVQYKEGEGLRVKDEGLRVKGETSPSPSKGGKESIVNGQSSMVNGKWSMVNDQWIDVDFDAKEQTAAPQGKLVLTFEPTKYLDDPKYYSHFTVTRITPEGGTSLLNFEEGQLDMGGGTSWSNTFRDGTMLDTGTYLLTTGTRLANGNVLATNRLFTIEEGKTTTLPLIIRQNDNEVSVIGTFDSESRFTRILSPAPNYAEGPLPVSVVSQTGRGYFVVGLVGMGQEPTNHALRDICKVKEDFDKWGRPMILLFESEQEAKKFKAEDYGTLPENTILGIDNDGTIRKHIAAQMKLDNASQLPIFFIADTFNRVVFCSQGYTIGLGEQMQWTILKL